MSLRTVLEQLRDYDGALLANTLDCVDSTPAHEFYMSGDIQSVTPTLGPTVGLAVTCQLDTSTPGGQSENDHYVETLESMEAMDEPSVWVVQTVGSRPDHDCTLGDGMAKMFHSLGCQGAVSDGRARDIAGLHATPFAVYCRGTAIHHCALRYKAVNVPIEVGGITVNPGDIIHASAEGVIKIPPGAVNGLLEKAPTMRAFEHEAHALVRRTDVSIRDKQSGVEDLLVKFGFTP